MFNADGTDLESRNDVALDSVTLRLGYTSHVEVTLERVERHSTANDGRIISHFSWLDTKFLLKFRSSLTGQS